MTPFERKFVELAIASLRRQDFSESLAALVALQLHDRQATALRQYQLAANKQKAQATKARKQLARWIAKGY